MYVHVHVHTYGLLYGVRTDDIRCEKVNEEIFLVSQWARARQRGRLGRLCWIGTLPLLLLRRQLWISILSPAYPPLPCQHSCLREVTKKDRIDASYSAHHFKSRQTTSEGAWALFVRLCRYADNVYSIFRSL